MLAKLSVCLCLSACWTIAAAQIMYLYEGDICKQTEGALWTCKLMSDCPKAQENLRNKGQRPNICNFNNNEPIVCCEPSVKPPPIGAKSKQMCTKYADSVYIRLQSDFGDDYTSVDTCSAVEPLITNGMNSQPREYPHMALIGYGNDKKWLCGGSLISERFILSAAHCTDAGKRGLARWARLGEYNVQSKDDDSVGFAEPEDYEIIERINHPQYKPPSLYNDITLYKLNKNVQFNEFIRPICLQTDHTFPKTYAIATGWGHLEYRGRASDILQKVNLTITPRKKCNDEFRAAIGEKLQDGIRDVSMLCAGDIINGGDTCQGDSGGPLQLRLAEPYCMYSQIGVTSFGSRCGESKPGVYTRVSHYIPWIESIVWP